MWEESLVPGTTYKTYALCPADQQRLEAVQAPNDAVLRSYVSGTSPGVHRSHHSAQGLQSPVWCTAMHAQQGTRASPDSPAPFLAHPLLQSMVTGSSKRRWVCASSLARSPPTPEWCSCFCGARGREPRAP